MLASTQTGFWKLPVWINSFPATMTITDNSQPTARLKSIRFHKSSAEITFELQVDGMKPSTVTIEEHNDNPELNMLTLVSKAYSKLSDSFYKLKRVADKEGDKWRI